MQHREDIPTTSTLSSPESSLPMTTGTPPADVPPSAGISCPSSSPPPEKEQDAGRRARRPREARALPTQTDEFIEPLPHVMFISWGKALEWAIYQGFPFTTKSGLMKGFKRVGGKFGKKAKSPHKGIPVPVDQFRQFLGGFKIGARRGD